MKTPGNFRQGGSGRPPSSDRGPYKGPGGPSQRPQQGHGQGPRPPQGSGPRPQQGQGPRPAAPGRDREGQDRDQAPRANTLHAPKGAQAPRPQRDGDGFKPGAKPFRPHGGGSRPQPQRQEREARAPDAPKGAVWLYGHHAIAAALANPSRRLRHLLLTEEAETAITASFKAAWPLQPERTDRARLDQLLGWDVVHQGAALLADPLPQPSLQSVLEHAGPIVVLDQVSDPRNVGAIMRSAAAFGAAAVIVQDRNAPDETGALAKAASGALEILPLLRAVNITRTLIALKAANIWCIGLDAAGPALSGASFAGRRVALVLGSEGEGMRRLTRETCDEVVGLAIKGVVESLNVSAAAAVALYELTRP